MSLAQPGQRALYAARLHQIHAAPRIECAECCTNSLDGSNEDIGTVSNRSGIANAESFEQEVREDMQTRVREGDDEGEAPMGLVEKLKSMLKRNSEKIKLIESSGKYRK